MRTLKHEFFHHAFICLASLCRNTVVGAIHHAKRFYVVRTLTPRADLHYDEAPPLDSDGIYIGHDGRFAIVGNDVGEGIHVLEERLVIHPDDRMFHITYAKNEEAALAIGKRHDCFQKRLLPFWQIYLELDIPALCFQ